MELTISKEQGGDGNWNSSDLLVFMKEISSDGVRPGFFFLSSSCRDVEAGGYGADGLIGTSRM